MEIAGYFAAIIIGVSLGLIGSGGSVLTVPVLVYLFGVDPVMATAYSLFIVGSTSLVGVFSRLKSGMVSLKTALIFGVPSILAVFITRKFIVPALPEVLFSVGQLELTKPVFIMLLFSVLMIIASISMIREQKVVSPEVPESERKYNFPLILTEGLVVGVLTGMVGAGGGFLIIPALVLFSKLPMKMAVGTSLLIISAKSLIGFLGDEGIRQMDWSLLLIVTGLAIVGIFAGNLLSAKINGHRLKKGFGWFILAMGAYIIIKEAF